MNPKELGQLLLYIVYQVADLGGYTTTIRLVKFLYLIDLEHYRRYEKTLTGLKWFFHLYGPYAFALPEICRRFGFDLEQEELEIQRGKTGRVFRVHEPQNPPKEMSFSVESMVNGLLQIWADQETSELLYYVYKSEPMIYGTQGQELDFSVVPRGSKYYELYIPVEKKIINVIREGLKAYAKDEADEMVAPQTKSNLIPQEVSYALEYEDMGEYSGITPSITDEKELRDSLPKGD